MLGVCRVLGRQVEDHPIEHFDGDRAGRDDLGQPIEGRLDGRERQHDQPLRGRERNDVEHGRGGDRQRPFRADDQFRQVELPGLVMPARGPHRQAGHELVEIVAAHPAQNVRKPVPDGLLVRGHRVAHDAMDRADRDRAEHRSRRAHPRKPGRESSAVPSASTASIVRTWSTVLP